MLISKGGGQTFSGGQHFQGGGVGSSFLQGVQLLVPMETYRTCNFLMRSEPPVPPPLWIRAWIRTVTDLSWSFSLRCLMALYLQTQILFLCKIASSFFTVFQKRPRLGSRIFVAETINRPVSYHLVVVKYEPVHEISNNVLCATIKASDQPAHTRSLIRAFASRLNILWMLSFWPNITWNF